MLCHSPKISAICCISLVFLALKGRILMGVTAVQRRLVCEATSVSSLVWKFQHKTEVVHWNIGLECISWSSPLYHFGLLKINKHRQCVSWKLNNMGCSNQNIAVTFIYEKEAVYWSQICACLIKVSFRTKCFKRYEAHTAHPVYLCARRSVFFG